MKIRYLVLKIRIVAFNIFGSIFLSQHHSEFEIRTKFCVFETRFGLIFSGKFSGVITLFANFECKCTKTVNFQTFCRKEKVFFLQYLRYHSPFDLFNILKPHAVHNLTAKALPYGIGTVLNKNMRFHLIGTGTGISVIGPGTFRKFLVVQLLVFCHKAYLKTLE